MDKPYILLFRHEACASTSSQTFPCHTSALSQKILCIYGVFPCWTGVVIIFKD